MAITLKPIRKNTLTLTIRGMSPLIQHAWSEKSKRQIREKQAGKKTKNRDARNPEQEAHDATYFTRDGEYAVPAMMVKSSLVTAAHKDLGVEKTLVRKALFIHCDDENGCLPLDCDPPTVREDTVRVGAGSCDLRYRPEFRRWSLPVTFTFDAELLREDDIINLLNRAGFGAGIGEWRPEKGGEFGRYEVDTESPINVGVSEAN